MAGNYETAAQLFMRLGPKHNLNGIDLKLFCELLEPMKQGDVVEIFGDEGSGKSEVLIHTAAKSILRNTWEDITIGGHQAMVIYIDCDSKFNILRLVAILESLISEQLNDSNLIDTHCKGIIKDSLKRFFYANVNSSTELQTTLKSFHQLFECNPNLCVLLIDNISSFYWHDRLLSGSGKYEQEANQRRIVTILKGYSTEQKILIIVTKPKIFPGKSYQLQTNKSKNSLKKHLTDNYSEYLCQEWHNLINIQFIVERQAVHSSKTTSKLFLLKPFNSSNIGITFSIGDQGIQIL